MMILVSIFALNAMVRLNAAVAPLSKITITSNKMVGSPTHNNDKDYSVAYTENVKVVLADASVITADKLEVTVRHGIVQEAVKKDAGQQKKAENLVPYKEVVFEGAVCIKRREHTVTADRAEFIVAKQACKVDGNVKIVQTNKQTDDMPMVTQSQRAYLDLTSEKLVLFGSEQKPVSTMLALGDTVKLQKTPTNNKVKSA